MAHSRMVRNWTERKVADYSVAPHRYTWSREAPEDAFSIPGSSKIAEWKAALPYRSGEVIMVDRNGKAVKAFIDNIIVEYDRFGDRVPVYQCMVETAQGVFSKVWSRFYASAVQRGYLLANMAPDLVGML